MAHGAGGVSFRFVTAEEAAGTELCNYLSKAPGGIYQRIIPPRTTDHYYIWYLIFQHIFVPRFFVQNSSRRDATSKLPTRD